MGCFALEEPQVSEYNKYVKDKLNLQSTQGTVMWFPSYRLLPKPVDFGFNRYVGDIRWRKHFPVHVAAFYSDADGYRWHDHGRHML
jgi:hypothetical protein